MRLLLVSCLAVLGCSNGPLTGDASVSDAAMNDVKEWCDGDITGCCAVSCDNDIGSTAWICVNGVRTCPAGTYSDIECKQKDPCLPIFCALPPAIPNCIACDGGASSQGTCDADAHVYVCPSNTYSEDDLDGASTCPADAGTD